MPTWLDSPNSVTLARWAAGIGALFAAVVALGVATIGRRFELWEQRRNDSLLGVVIVESLLEEIETGVKIMEDELERIRKNGPSPALVVPQAALPNASWNGMATIPDNVLLRIIATSREITAHGFPPHQVRIHCKNYFIHMHENFASAAYDSAKLKLLAPGRDNGDYVGIAKKVLQTLRQVRGLLEENSRKWFPG